MTTILIGLGCASVAAGLTLGCMLLLNRRLENRRTHRLGRWLRDSKALWRN
jgi:hypothetical protein